MHYLCCTFIKTFLVPRTCALDKVTQLGLCEMVPPTHIGLCEMVPLTHIGLCEMVCH